MNELGLIAWAKNCLLLLVSWMLNSVSNLDPSFVTYALSILATLVTILNGVLLFIKNIKKKD